MSINGISASNHQVRFQMQPPSVSEAGASSRGGGFARKLGQTRAAHGQGQTEDVKPKVKKRSVPQQFQQNDMELEARLLEQQMQAARQAKPAAMPRNFGG